MQHESLSLSENLTAANGNPTPFPNVAQWALYSRGPSLSCHTAIRVAFQQKELQNKLTPGMLPVVFTRSAWRYMTAVREQPYTLDVVTTELWNTDAARSSSFSHSAQREQWPGEDQEVPQPSFSQANFCFHRTTSLLMGRFNQCDCKR